MVSLRYRLPAVTLTVAPRVVAPTGTSLSWLINTLPAVVMLAVLSRLMVLDSRLILPVVLLSAPPWIRLMPKPVPLPVPVRLMVPLLL